MFPPLRSGRSGFRQRTCRPERPASRTLERSVAGNKGEGASGPLPRPDYKKNGLPVAPSEERPPRGVLWRGALEGEAGLP